MNYINYRNKEYMRHVIGFIEDYAWFRKPITKFMFQLAWVNI